jgi:hypothetical protein
MLSNDLAHLQSLKVDTTQMITHKKISFMQPCFFRIVPNKHPHHQKETNGCTKRLYKFKA